MHIFAIILFIFFPQLLPETMGSKKQGRQGNEHFEQDQFRDAAAAYARGLATYEVDVGPDRVYYGLQNNLGTALHHQEDFDHAQEAFTQAMDHASSEEDYARAAYNAGNNAFYRQDMEAALAHYKKALLADPTNEDAKFNYEVLKRQQQQEQEQEQQNQEGEEEQEEDQEGEDQNQDQENNEGEEENEQQNQEGEEEQEQNQESQNENQNGQEEEEQQQEGQQQPSPQQLSRAQAERILQALENEEEQLLREIQKVEGRRRRVAKDW